METNTGSGKSGKRKRNQSDIGGADQSGVTQNTGSGGPGPESQEDTQATGEEKYYYQLIGRTENKLFKTTLAEFKELQRLNPNIRLVKI